MHMLICSLDRTEAFVKDSSSTNISLASQLQQDIRGLKICTKELREKLELSK